MKNENLNKSKIFYMALSFLLASVVWYIADETQATKANVTISDIPIEYVREDTVLASRGMMLLDGSQDSVTLKLEGSRKAIADLDPDLVHVQVDLAGVSAAGRQNLAYQIVYPNPSSYFSSSLTNISTTNTVSVNVGEMYSSEVEIRYDIRGTVAEGYIAGEVQLQPEALVIQGQEKEVNSVRYAQVILNIDNAQKTVSESLEYVLYDQFDQPVTEHNLRLSTEKVTVTMPVNVVKELPLRVNFIESVGSRLSNSVRSLEPQSVTVCGDAALLENIDSILLDTVDLAAIDSDTTFNYVIPLPEGCENLSGETRATLKFSYKDLKLAEFSATNFLCENAPVGKVVKILTSQLRIKLRGTSVDVGAIRPEQVLVVADLSEISAASGSYTVAATIRITTPGDVAVVGDYQVRVNISEPAPEPEPQPEPPADPGTVTDPSASQPQT